MLDEERNRTDQCDQFLGMAHIYLKALFYGTNLDCTVPIISLQGEVRHVDSHRHILSMTVISKTVGTMHILLSQSSLLLMTAPQSDSNSDILDSISQSFCSASSGVDD